MLRNLENLSNPTKSKIELPKKLMVLSGSESRLKSSASSGRSPHILPRQFQTTQKHDLNTEIYREMNVNRTMEAMNAYAVEESSTTIRLLQMNRIKLKERLQVLILACIFLISFLSPQQLFIVYVFEGIGSRVREPSVVAACEQSTRSLEQ